MFSKTKLAVDIGSSNIKILVGSSTKIEQYGLIKTPANSFIDGKVINIDTIVTAVKDFIRDNRVKAKTIAFSVHGQEVIARHIEIPVMDKKALRSSVQWEIGQYLPQNGENYYIDFQILKKTKNSDKKVYSLLVVAVPKEKVDNYIEISEKLKLKVSAIDISSNCIARVFKEHFTRGKNFESVGIIDIGSRTSSIVIMDKGSLFMEKEVSFGIMNVMESLSKILAMDYNHTVEYFKSNFDFNNIDHHDDVETKIITIFDNILITFEKTIQFYTAGKTKKQLDKVYLIGGATGLTGIADYLTSYFNSNVQIINSVKDLSLKVKINKAMDSKLFINALGLLIRKE